MFYFPFGGKNLSRKGAEIAKVDENGIGKEMVGTAIAVQRAFGPGLLATVYRSSFCVVPCQSGVGGWLFRGFGGGSAT